MCAQRRKFLEFPAGKTKPRGGALQGRESHEIRTWQQQAESGPLTESVYHNGLVLLSLKIIMSAYVKEKLYATSP